MSSKNLRSINPTEHQIQSAIVEWAYNNRNPWNSLRIGDLLIKNANEGKRSWVTGKKMRKEGLRKGVSDLFLAFPAYTKFNNDTVFFSGLWIEVKTAAGRVSSHQFQWAELMMLVGYRVVLVRGVDEGIKAIKDYLGMR